MAKRPTLSTLSNILTSLPFINTNYDAIDTAFDNTISRDGSTPNNMTADLDLDGNSLLNVNSLSVTTLEINGEPVVPTGTATIEAVPASSSSITDSGAFYTGANVELALQEVGVDIASLEADIATNVTNLGTKAPLASPALTGTPTAPTATAGTNTTQVATTAFVQQSLPSTYSGTTTTATGSLFQQVIPSGVTEVMLSFDELSASSSVLSITIGTGGASTTSGYFANSVLFNTSATTDEVTGDQAASRMYLDTIQGDIVGTMMFRKMAGESNTWLSTHTFASGVVGNSGVIGAGVVTLAGELDLLEVIPAAPFSQGKIHVNWRY